MLVIIFLLAAIFVAVLLTSEDGRLFVVWLFKAAGVLAAVGAACFLIFIVLALRNGHPG